jgi:hypothetical protein
MAKKKKKGEWKPVELRGNRPRGHVILTKKDKENERSQSKKKIEEEMEG